MFTTFILSSALGVAMPAAEIGFIQGLDPAIETLRSTYGVDGLAVSVVQGDDVILAKGYGTLESQPAHAGSTCQLYSATKALTALTLVSMIEDGQVDVQVSIGDLWPDAPAHWSAIPLWRLYNHTSGLPMVVNQPDFGSIAEDPQAGNQAVFEMIADAPLDFAPGERSRYQQSGYGVAELIHESRLGQNWAELVHTHLTGPAGADQTEHAHLADDVKTVPMLVSAGFFRTTPADMALIFRALNAGDIADQQALSALLFDPAYHSDNYGLGVIIETVAGELTLGHRGGGARANLRYAPQSEVGVMACTDQQDNRQLTIDVADMVMHSLITQSPPRLPIASLLYGMTDQPASALIAAYDAERAKPDSVYEFSNTEQVLNRLAYAQLETAPVEAQALFVFNAQLFPQSANVWDSLADAQQVLGDQAGALESVRRAVSLAADSARLQDRLTALQTERN